MKAIIYTRVSTQDQDNKRQITELTDYAKYKKFEVVKVFEEKISGGTKASDRTEFSRLLDFIETEKVDNLLVWELSRLGRSMLDVMNTIEKMSDKKVNIFIKKEGINTLDDKGQKSTMTNIIISVLSGFAEMERETIKQRAISGIRQNVARGGSGTGFVKAYGFETIDKKLVIHKEEASVVKMIFEKYLSGLGTQQIAKFLNNKNIPTRFNKLYGDRQIKQKYGVMKKGTDFKWKDGTIYSILTNSIYKGDRKHKGEIFNIDAIIDKNTFDKVRSRLKSNYNKKDSNRKYPNALKDLIICGKCGRGYFMHQRANNKDSAYKCISKRYNEYCGNPSISISKLLEALFIVCQPIVYSDAIEKTVDFTDTINDNIENKVIEIENAHKEIERINGKLERLIKLNLEDELSIKQFSSFKAEFIKEIDKNEEKLKKFSFELSKLEKLKRKRPKSEENYSRDYFEKYVSDAIDHIKIYEVKNIEMFRDIFPSKQDVAVLVEVKSTLVFNNGGNISYHFIISQRSKQIVIVAFDSETTDLTKQIIEGTYMLEVNFGMEEFENPFQMKNPYIIKSTDSSYL